MEDIVRLRDYCKIDREMATENSERGRYMANTSLYASIGLGLAGVVSMLFRHTSTPFFVVSSTITACKYMSDLDKVDPNMQEASQRLESLENEMEKFLGEKEKTPEIISQKIEMWNREYTNICHSIGCANSFRRMHVNDNPIID